MDTPGAQAAVAPRSSYPRKNVSAVQCHHATTTTIRVFRHFGRHARANVSCVRSFRVIQRRRSHWRALLPRFLHTVTAVIPALRLSLLDVSVISDGRYF